MNYPLWRKFEAKCEDSIHTQFEDLCRLLFCREIGIEPNTLVSVKNQAGNETEVVLYKGELVGFQCKYFEKKYDFEKFKESIFKARKYNSDQRVIYLYSNIEIPSVEAMDKLKDYVSSLDMECKLRFNKQILDQIVNQGYQDIYDTFFNLDSDEYKVFRPYENELSVGKEKPFLDDASENLIKEKKVLRNEEYIDKVKRCLDSKKFCLIKAPEGRGKTYLSRIIAYDYLHNNGMKIFFLDLKDHKVTVRNIDDKLQKWHINSGKDYLLIIENVHAYDNLIDFENLIKGWINLENNHIRFLLNTRPTDVELDVFSDCEEVVELKPNKEDISKIINLFTKEVGREPFANIDERDRFIKKIYPNNNKGKGANLRLLKIYLDTWQKHPEIQYITSVSENTVVDDYKKFYLRNRTREEKNALWYISSMYQFDVPLHEDFVPNVGNLVVDGVLRFEDNKYHLPHSVDASFLYKAICKYKHVGVAVQMKTFTTRFVETILKNNNPRIFESDFKLLNAGLYARKDDYKIVFYYLTSEEISKQIIEKIHPGFVISFFRPQTHEESNIKTLTDYYRNNKDLLKKIFLEDLSSFELVLAYNTLKKLKIDAFQDFFKSSIDLDQYLSINDNYKVLSDHRFFSSLLEYKEILIEHYKKNKDNLKPLFFKIAGSLPVVYRTFKNLGIDIYQDFFKSSIDLDNYLSINVNYKVLSDSRFLSSFLEHKEILIKHYENKKDNLKPLFLEKNHTRLHFAYRSFKNLGIDIYQDIFKSSIDLDDYLSINDNYKALSDSNFLSSFLEHKEILIKHYEKNKDNLKTLLIGLSPERLTYLYIYYNYLNINIVKDIFNSLKDLEDYLGKNGIQTFKQDIVLRAICEFRDEHKIVLKKYNAFDHFFYTTKSANNVFWVNGRFIYNCLNKKRTFDIDLISKNSFYLDGISWNYLQKFVYLIKENMTQKNKQKSVKMVQTILKIVFTKEKALFYALSSDLAYFYYNIASIDEGIFQKLKENDLVRKDIMRRLKASSYEAGDLYLFDLFFLQSWCKAELEHRIQNADKAQQMIISKWHNGVMKKLKDRGDEITSGTLLDYIHNLSIPSFTKEI